MFLDPYKFNFYLENKSLLFLKMASYSQYLTKDQEDELRAIANAIVRPGKGILAADESIGKHNTTLTKDDDFLWTSTIELFFALIITNFNFSHHLILFTLRIL